MGLPLLFSKFQSMTFIDPFSLEKKMCFLKKINKNTQNNNKPCWILNKSTLSSSPHQESNDCYAYMLGPGTVSMDCSFLCYLVVTLKPKCFTTVPTGASAYLIIKLVHGHGGHGVAVGLCPIPMAVLGVNPVAGFRAELCAVLAVPVFTGVHHIHRSWPRRDPSLVWGRRRRRGLTMHSPFCKWQYNTGLRKWATYNREKHYFCRKHERQCGVVFS